MFNFTNDISLVVSCSAPFTCTERRGLDKVYRACVAEYFWCVLVRKHEEISIPLGTQEYTSTVVKYCILFMLA